jgi:hypothetical protein
MVVIHLCVKMSVFAVSMATAGILKKSSDLDEIWFPSRL